MATPIDGLGTEPTVRLHMADVESLIHVLHRPVDAGNSVIVIEHNLDIMVEADWIIDMGRKLLAFIVIIMPTVIYDS